MNETSGDEKRAAELGGGEVWRCEDKREQSDFLGGYFFLIILIQDG